MNRIDLTIEICGLSGDGTIAAGGLLNEAMSRAGFSALAFDSYPAEIRGFGRCVTRSRFGFDRQIALENQTNLLISLDDEQSLSRLPFLAADAVVLFDNHPPSPVAEGKSIAGHARPAMSLFGAPFRDLAAAASGSAKGRNLAALGVLAGLLNLPVDAFRERIGKKFKSKGEKVAAGNIRSFDAGLEYVLKTYPDRLRPLPVPAALAGQAEKVLWSGNVAIGEGALAAGLKNYFGYPITPATPIMEYLAARLPAKGGRVLQVEDEISAIGAVLGSFYTGARAMTATSGPGFALMTELITQAVSAESPAVIVDAQRGGPSTGLPTKTEQSDLLAAVFGGPGDTPRIVIAPTDVTECYHLTARAFPLAEKYQTPVIVLTDFYLDNRVENIERPSISADAVADALLKPAPDQAGSYHRYQVTPSGISPRALPGTPGFQHNITGLEHDERGVPDFSPGNHQKMSDKRDRKIQGALADLDPPEEYGDPGPLDVGVVAWGSTFGSALDAVQSARDQGLKVGCLKITTLFPYHEDRIQAFMDRSKTILIPELNHSGQLNTLIGHLGRGRIIRLNQSTGIPLYPSTILGKIHELIGEDRS